MAIDPTLTAPSEAPCEPWCTVEDLNACGSTEGVDAAAIDWSIALAGRILWAGSGRRYGLCLRSVRPCYSGPHSCWSGGVCGCHLPALHLPGPIAAVHSITVDGVALDSSVYRIQTSGLFARRQLLRLDDDTWWCCNDLDADPDVVPADSSVTCPAWSVTYWQGRAIPPVATAAAALLALEITKEFGGVAEACGAVQPNLTQINRRGVSMQFEPSMPEVLGGIKMPKLAAAWLDSVNPHKLQRRSTAYSVHANAPQRVWSWVDANMEEV